MSREPTHNPQQNIATQDEWDRFKEEVRDRGMRELPRIIETYGDTTLRKTGPGQYMGCCPFHIEKTPSFSVSSKGYYCYGAGCDAKGDVITFIQEKKGLKFVEALRFLAEDLGVPVPDGKRAPAARKVSEPKPPADPADEFLAEADRLHPHDLVPVPAGMWTPKPGRLMSIYREEARDERTGEVMRTAGVKRYKPEMVHEYRTVDNELILTVLRLRFNEGKKFFFSLCAREPIEGTPDNLIRNGVSWQIRSGNEGRRPVYGAHRVNEWLADPDRGPILLVEGEKCVDYALREFPEPGTLVLSATGGFNACILADWKPIAERMAQAGVIPAEVIIWPDKDPKREMKDGTVVDVQELYAKRVFSGFVRDLKEALGNDTSLAEIKFTRVIPPENKEKGWDIADAIDEDSTRADLERYMQNAVPVDLSHMASYAPELAESAPSDDSLSAGP